MKPAEPSLSALPNPVLRYFLAVRPAFLTVTLVGCLLGLATALAAGAGFHLATAVITVLFALVAHAGANVVNDFYDSRNGTDAANTERLFPFTGGSRFIQNGVLSEAQTGRFGYTLLASVIPAGLWLTSQAGPGLIWLGLAGLLVGWAYSAPPLKLVCRGLGEVAITAGWLLVVVGADFVQRQAFSFTPVAGGLSFALLVVNILYINQFPDRRADAQAGKATLVVRLGVARARWGYFVIAGLAHVWLLLMVLMGALPWPALAGLLSLPLCLAAGRDLLAHADNPPRLQPAIGRTIGAAHVHGVLVILGLIAAAVMERGA